MTAESSGSAAQDGAHDLELLETKLASVAIDERVALRAEDVGHLHGGPVRSFFFRPDRLIVSSVETQVASTGLLTEYICRAQRCKYNEVRSRSARPTKRGSSRTSSPAYR